MADPLNSVTDRILAVMFFPLGLTERVRPKALKFACVWVAAFFALALMFALFPLFVVFAVWETMDG